MSAAEALRVSGLNAWYGESHVLHGVDLTVCEGEVVALLGRNGTGRSTTLKAILGLAGRMSGSVQFHGTEIAGRETHEIARLGIGYCPEERAIFSSLTTEENLMLPPIVGRGGGLSLEEIYRMFPNLHDRRSSRGTSLSGGEQQMLAMARILRTGARLLLLDEITEGLAPLIVKHLQVVISDLKARGFTILLVEQNFRFACALADRHCVMEGGRVVATVDKSQLQENAAMLAGYLGV